MARHTVLSLALALTSLSLAKERNATFREVMVWQDACNVLAGRARQRVIHFAMLALRCS
jgi:hypothetical protein